VSKQNRRFEKLETYSLGLHPKVRSVPNDGFIEDLKKVDPCEDREDNTIDLAAYVAALRIPQSVSAYGLVRREHSTDLFVRHLDPLSLEDLLCGIGSSMQDTRQRHFFLGRE
jgi:hypothetical protein